MRAEALDNLCSVLKQNKEIRRLVLGRNRLGVGPNVRERMKYFLEAFTLDLHMPTELDLRENEFDDECLYPIIKYFFADR